MTPQIPTLEQLRKDIDDARTGEKVCWPDPAAAPLGTDDEASGNPPTPQERAMAAQTRPKIERRHNIKALPLAIYLAVGACVAAVLLAVIELST